MMEDLTSDRMLAPDINLTAEQGLSQRFPGVIKLDDRNGYSGFIVEPDNLLGVAAAIRDDYGYDYLTSVTGVDYLPEHMIEVVYHAFRSIGGSALVFKTRVPRENPVVPSLYSVFPGVDFQEREAWDLLGIKFEGHPDLRRILMWEGFDGFPLRKDWREPFYEEEGKPFKSRWPEVKLRKLKTKILTKIIFNIQ